MPDATPDAETRRPASMAQVGTEAALNVGVLGPLIAQSALELVGLAVGPAVQQLLGLIVGGGLSMGAKLLRDKGIPLDLFRGELPFVGLAQRGAR